jgi:phage major head subunit gpT-like protein
MATVTSDFISGLFTNFSVIFEEEFLAADTAVDYERYCTVVNSQTDTESYNFLDVVPKMVEFLDERQIQGQSALTFNIKNRRWEVTIGVDRVTLSDDKYGLIKPRIAQLGREAARFPAELAASVLATGASNVGYDGSNFFDTNHVQGSVAAQSNKLTGTGTTLAQFRADVIAARTAMSKFQDGSGRYMGLNGDLIVIGPTLRDVAEQLINTNIIALSSGTQQSNVLRGSFDIMVDPWIEFYNPSGHSNDWYLLDTKSVIKPLIFQWREAPEFVAQDKVDDFHVFNTDQFLYGVRARFNAGPALWYMALQIVN